MKIDFNASEGTSLGVEMELELVDRESWPEYYDVSPSPFSPLSRVSDGGRT